MKLIIGLMLLTLSLLGDSAGTVINVEGNVFLKKADQSQYKRVNLNHSLFQGDELRTGPKGRVKLIFSDDSVLFLGTNGKMVIAQHHFNRATKKRKTEVNLVSGRLKAWVSSVLTKKNNFSVRTKTAVIGVRGTQFIVNVTGDQETEVGVINGSVAVQNLLDTTQTEVLLKPNTYTRLLGTSPAMPGLEMTSEHLKRLNHGLNIKQNMIFKPDFQRLNRGFKLKNMLKNQSFNMPQNKRLSGKKGKKNLPRLRHLMNNPYLQGYLQRPKMKIKVNLTIKRGGE